MSVEEIIEQIKALPQDEFRKVIEFVNKTQRAEETEAAIEVRPGFGDVARQVFERHDDLFRKLAK